MEPLKVTAQELLEAWRDAARAAELADRLAANAVQAANDADERSIVSAELATLAEAAAEHAERCATRARSTAKMAASLAKQLRQDGVPDAQRIAQSAHAVESEANTAYREAEANTRGDA